MSHMKYRLLALVILIVSSAATIAFYELPYDRNQLYYQIIDNDKNKVLSTLKQISNEFNNYQYPEHYFWNDRLYERYRNSFKYGDKDLISLFSLKIDARQLTLIREGEYKFISKIQLKYDKNVTVPIDLNLKYHNESNSFLIKDFSIGNIPNFSNFESIGSITHPDREDALLCNSNTIAESGYVNLMSKEGDKIHSAQYLGQSMEYENTHIPIDYYGTESFVQKEFPKRKVDDKEFDVGYVISRKDTEDVGLSPLFSNIRDADGVFEVFSITERKLVNLPTGFFIDELSNRIIILNNENKFLLYGKRDQDKFLGYPSSLKAIGRYLYVYDSYYKNILIFRIIAYGDKTELSYITELDKESDISNVLDIGGYEGKESNYLFLVNGSGDVTSYIINPDDGTPKSFPILHTFSSSNFSSDITKLGGVKRIAARGISADERKFSLVCTSSRDVIAIKGSVEDPAARIEKRTTFDSESFLTGVGFNIGENTFNITDNIGKIHTFSFNGDYLGSGGKSGRSEINNELYLPVGITSNIFTGEAKESIVINTWADDTGFKRILPTPSLGKVTVIERFTTQPSAASEEVLIARYALTSGWGIEKVILRLNGAIVREVTSGHSAAYHAEEFALHEGDLSNVLKIGWNTLEVTAEGVQLALSSGARFSQTKSHIFYYHPSTVSTTRQHPFDDLYRDDKGNIIIYKSLNINGTAPFILNDETIRLTRGSILHLSGETPVEISNSKMSFECGSVLQVKVAQDTAKIFKNIEFDGLLENSSLITLMGEYTGGQGISSSPSSKAEFINCFFSGYTSKALTVQEGRSTFVNCTFNNTAGSGYAVSGVFLAPETRGDFIGCIFEGNDIGIDAIGASVILDTKAGKYKGIDVNNSQLTNNRIGVFGFASSIRTSETAFLNNTYAIVCLEGSLDISNNANNEFNTNGVAVLVSNYADSDKGRNKFIHNTKDVVIIGSPSTPYNFQCNYWESANSSGNPSIYLTNDLLDFTKTISQNELIYSPFMESIEETKCKGTIAYNDEVYSENTKNVNQAIKALLNKEPGRVIVNESHSLPTDIQYGSYSYDDIRDKMFRYKTVVAGKVYKSEMDNPEILLQEFYRMVGNNRNYAATILDKLAYLRVEHSNLPNTLPSIEKEVFALDLYPNPAQEILNLRITSAQSGTAEYKIVDGRGNSNKVLLKGFIQGSNYTRLMISSLPAGIYILVVSDGKNITTSKFIKQ